MVSSMPKNKQILMIYLFLTITTLMVFWKVTACDFINYDDQGYVTGNQQVQNGITLEGIRWAFTTGAISNWHPVTWISHMMDVQLFGMQPGWHHLMNLLFHLANTLLLFFVLHRMTKARWESAFVAALFALHPLHVESVAWVAERRDVLSTFFWILTMAAYCTYVERPGLRRYLLVVLFFALGLMSKPMLVTLPFVLLLLDYWPLRRFQQIPSEQKIGTAVKKDKQKGKKKQTAGEEAKAAAPADAPYQWALIRPLLLEKTPLFALTALSSIVTYIVQQKGGAVSSFETMPLSARIANALVSYVIYIGKTIWPNDLAILYPHPLSWPAWQVLGAVLFLTAVTVTAIWKAGRIPYLATGWLWFAGTLVPVIGLVQVGIQARADRYTYVPLIGLFIIAAWGIPELSRKWRYRKEVLFASSTAVLLCLCLVTWTQVGYWKDSITLFDHTLNVTDNNYTAYYNRGTAYWHRGNFQQAMENFNKVIEINPNEAEFYRTRGNANLYLGNFRQAIGDYDKLIEIDPGNEDVYNSRGNAYSNLGNDRQAIGDYDRALSINPNDAKAHTYRGNIYLRLGNYQQAIEDYDKALSLNPKEAETYYNRGYAYQRLGNTTQAIEDLKAAARLGHKKAQDLLMSKGMR
jgi:tetratricopeptide (TPR) repeat protein